MSGNNLIKVFVKNLEDRTIKVEVDKNCTLAQLKTKISEYNGVAPDLQRLFCGAKHLNDERKTIAEYAIVDGTVVHLLKRSEGSGVGHSGIKDFGDTDGFTDGSLGF